MTYIGLIAWDSRLYIKFSVLCIAELIGLYRRYLTAKSPKLSADLSCIPVIFSCLVTQTWRSPVLLALQQLPVGVDLHVQGQFDVQQLLVLVELLLHALPQLGHLALPGVQLSAVLVPVAGQHVLQLADALLSGRRLRGGGARTGREWQAAVQLIICAAQRYNTVWSYPVKLQTEHEVSTWTFRLQLLGFSTFRRFIKPNKKHMLQIWKI